MGSDARYLLQVSELLERIVRNRKMGVIVVSVVLNFTQDQNQPLQRCRRFGFQYLGTTRCSKRQGDRAGLAGMKKEIWLKDHHLCGITSWW